jgi:toxin FitB
MEQKFLIDTNILIYYFDDLIPGNTVHIVDEIFSKSFNISIISKVEFLGWQKFDEEQYKKAALFVDGSTVISLSEKIANEAIHLKRQKRMKLPDAVIVSTCLINGFTLVTRDHDDFKGIKGVKIYNPFDTSL